MLFTLIKEDVLGRGAKPNANAQFIETYYDRTVEKRIVIE